MSIRYVVSKRVFGFDEKKAEKFVAEPCTLGMIEFDDLCEEVMKVGLVPKCLTLSFEYYIFASNKPKLYGGRR